eukprot:g3708.t1
MSACITLLVLAPLPLPLLLQMSKPSPPKKAKLEGPVQNEENHAKTEAKNDATKEAKNDAIAETKNDAKAEAKKSTDALGEEINLILKEHSDATALCQALDALVAKEGVECVGSWKDSSKHKHGLVHLLTIQGRSEALQHMVDKHGLDINAPRPSDQCTPAHLCKWYRKEDVMKTIIALGADLSLKNKYKETAQDLVSLVEKIKNIIWLDLELTSLEEPQVMECAVIITDKDLKEVARQSWVDLKEVARHSWVVHFEPEELSKLGAWHQKTFAAVDAGGNGLLAACAASTLQKAQFEKQLLAFLNTHCPPGLCPLGGSSVHCDRDALRMCHPKVHKFFSHRVIDVSTILGLLERWSPNTLAELYASPSPTQTSPSLASSGEQLSAHRALWDIERSLASLKWIRQHVMKM